MIIERGDDDLTGKINYNNNLIVEHAARTKYWHLPIHSFSKAILSLLPQ